MHINKINYIIVIVNNAYLATVPSELLGDIIFAIIIVEQTHIETYKPLNLASTNLPIICKTADQEFQQLYVDYIIISPHFI